MNLKKAIRKVAAVGAGMTMVGATLMGALAANLNEYPAPFVTDGAFDAVLVVGDNAAPVDIIGVTDVAMALQYGMTTETAVETSSSTTSVTDGTVEDELTLGYDTFVASKTYNDGDITVLKDDELRYNSADVNYKEIIGFEADTFVAETGEHDEDFGTDVYLTVNSDEIYYIWQPDSPLDANFTADETLDISFMGMDLQITGVPDDNKLTLSSANEVWLNRGESITETVSGEEYTIEFAGAYGDDAKFVLNGETDYVSATELFDEEYDDFELEVIEVVDDTSDANEDAVKFKYGSTTSEVANTLTAAEMLGYGDETSKAEWVWYIESTAATETITYVGVKYHQPLDEIEAKITASWEKPVLGVGDSIVFPNDYAQIEFAALNFADDLADFTVTSKTASNWYNDDDVQVFAAASDYVIEFYSADGDYLYYEEEPYTTVMFDKDLSNVGLVDSSDVNTNTTFNSTGLVIKVDDTEHQVTVTNNTEFLDDVEIAGLGGNSAVLGTYESALVWNLDWTEDATAAGDMFQFPSGTNLSTRDYDFSTEYGAIIYDPESGMEDDYGYIKFSLPSEKVTFDLAVSAESATTSTSSVTTQTVTQIEVGAAKLASEVADITAVNAIVIGGPCANAAAATLMGNPSPCYAGFTEGEATVKLYENGGNVAMLIAGATGDDTRTAAKVVANGGIAAIDGTEAVVTTLTETVTVPTVVDADAE